MAYLMPDVGAATGVAYMLQSPVSSDDATFLTLRNCMDCRGFYTRFAKAKNGLERCDFSSVNHSGVDKNMRSRYHIKDEKTSIERMRIDSSFLLSTDPDGKGQVR